MTDMLGQVSGNHDEELIKNIKRGDFSVGVYPKTRYSPDESEVFEVHYGTPKRGFTTARLRANLRGFRINLSVVCPEPEKPKGCQTLTRREGDDVTKAMHNLIEVLIKHAFGEDLTV